jgi:hypothetical protein
MLSGSLVVLALLISGPKGPRHPLPPSAVVRIDRSYIDPGTAESDISFCKRYHLSPSQIRKQFRTFRELKPGELHDYYLFVPCGQEGTVTVNGKTFHWRTQMGGTMKTDWPDGVIKDLGGPSY